MLTVSENQLNLFDSICIIQGITAQPASKESFKIEVISTSKLDKLLSNLLEISKKEISFNHFNKESYKKASLSFLRFLSKELAFSESKISFNPGGIAVCGESSLYGMWGEKGVAIYLINDIGSFRIMYRSISHMQDYKGDRNKWIYSREIERGYDFIKKSFLSLKED